MTAPQQDRAAPPLCPHCRRQVRRLYNRGLCATCCRARDVRQQYPTLALPPEWVGRRCRHCHAALVARPRGLCWSCYYSAGVRENYPSTSKYANRGLPNFNGRGLPCEPTDALPGSPEKVAVMEERARRRQQLFHPLDAQLDGGALRALVAA